VLASEKSGQMNVPSEALMVPLTVSPDPRVRMVNRVSESWVVVTE
jgi:hypothetical protein